jgi:hypothetical protein
MENELYDVVVVEFQKGDKSAGAISIKKSDIDVMINLHGQTIESIIGDMAKTLEKAIMDADSRKDSDGKTEG